MKKIIITLIALVLVLSVGIVAFIGCKKNDDDNQSEEPTVTKKDLFEVVSESKQATKIVTLVQYKTGNDTLEGEFVLVLVNDNASRLDYSYDEYNTIEDATELGGERIVNRNGHVIHMDGMYSTDEGKTWGAVAPDVKYNSLELNLDKSLLRDVAVSADGLSVVAKIDKANFVSVIGVDLDTTEATITIITDSKSLRSIKLEYTTAAGDIVVINTSYTYDARSLADILK